MVNFLHDLPCKLNCCKKKSRLKKKIDSIKKISHIISEKLDLKKILIKLYNFELNLKSLNKEVNLDFFNKNKFEIMDRWKDEYPNT